MRSQKIFRASPQVIDKLENLVLVMSGLAEAAPITTSVVFVEPRPYRVHANMWLRNIAQPQIVQAEEQPKTRPRRGQNDKKRKVNVETTVTAEGNARIVSENDGYQPWANDGNFLNAPV